MATMPLGTGAELSTGLRAVCQFHYVLQNTTSMGSGGSRTEDRRYDAGVDFVKELTLLKQECHTIFGKHFQILEGFLWEVVFIL